METTIVVGFISFIGGVLCRDWFGLFKKQSMTQSQSQTNRRPSQKEISKALLRDKF